MERFDEIRRHQDDQLLLQTVMRSVTEERTKNRQVTQPRNARGLRVQGELQEASNRQRLALVQFDRGVRFTDIQTGDWRAAWHQYGADAEVDGADLGINGETDRIAVQDGRNKVQPDAELFERDRDRRAHAARRGLRYGNGEFAAGQEAGSLAVHGNQIRLRQNAHQRVLAQGA